MSLSCASSPRHSVESGHSAPAVKSCGAVCAQFGGECELTLDSVATCMYGNETKDCNFTGYNDAICRCSLGCGNGPPCAANKTCTAGTCKP